MAAPIAPQNIKSDPFSTVMLEQIFIDFLHGDRSAKIYNFLYRDELNTIALPDHSGIAGWDGALKQDNSYYIYPNEVDLISRLPDMLGDLPYCSTLIELGIGSQKSILSKTIPILNAVKPQRFIINDISSAVVTKATAIIEREFPALLTRPMTADFLNQQSKLYETSDANVIITGSTISNITAYNGRPPVNEVVLYLKTISKLIGSKGTLIITQDTNQDEISLKAAYSEPDLIKFRLDMLYRLNKFLNVKDFDLSALKYEPVWEAQSHLLANTFINTKDQKIKIGDEMIALPAGQRLYISNCYKYPLQTFLHMAMISGLYPVWTKPDCDNRIVVHALRLDTTTQRSLRMD